MARRTVSIPPFALPGDGGMTLTKVKFQLVDSNLKPVLGIADGTGIVGTLVVDINGVTKDIDLTINSTITPINTQWAITVTATGVVYQTVYRTVDAGSGSINFQTWVGSVL